MRRIPLPRGRLPALRPESTALRRDGFAPAAEDSTGAVVAAATETKQVSTSFFAGIKFAINERRGVKPVAPITKDDAAKREEAERKLREAQDLYARAHATSNDGALVAVTE